MRPLIAVPGRRILDGGIVGWRHGGVAVPERYVAALHRAGGEEAILHPVVIEEKEAEARLERFDGLLLIGGGDVHPARYGEEPHPAVYGVEADADAFETALAQAAVRRRIPTLAVCRGAQVLNVALGGTLEQHIADLDAAEHGTRGEHLHAVQLEPGSRTAAAMESERVDCVSSHHQAVGKIGRGLVPVGWADDGVIEAIEHEDGWLVGVQWHPERSAARDPAQQRLFDALVARAEERDRT